MANGPRLQIIALLQNLRSLCYVYIWPNLSYFNSVDLEWRSEICIFLKKFTQVVLIFNQVWGPIWEKPSHWPWVPESLTLRWE